VLLSGHFTRDFPPKFYMHFLSLRILATYLAHPGGYSCCKFWGIRGGDDSNRGLLGCDVVWCCFGDPCCLLLQEKVAWTSETSVSCHNNALRHNPEGLGFKTYGGVSESFRTGRLERELQMVQLSATRFSCITILWVSLMSFATVTFCVASQRVFIVVSLYFVTTQSGNFWIYLRMFCTIRIWVDGL
jgi:hypothetical protein